MLGGPLGGLAGAAFGHMYDVTVESEKTIGERRTGIWIKNIKVATGIIPEISRSVPVILIKLQVGATELSNFLVIATFKQHNQNLMALAHDFASPDGTAVIIQDESMGRWHDGFYEFHMAIPEGVLDIPYPDEDITAELMVVAGGQLIDKIDITFSLSGKKAITKAYDVLNILWGAVLADSEVDRLEVRKLKEILTKEFNFSQEELQEAKEYFKQLNITRQQALDSATVVAAELSQMEKERIMLLVLSIVAADHKLVPQEIEYVNKLAALFSIDKERLNALYKQDDLAGRLHALSILGLSFDASREDIRRRFKELALKYHPDKLQNLDEEFRKFGEEKFKEIKSAYDYLMEQNL